MKHRNVTLKARLFAEGLSQRALALTAGMSETKISSIVNGWSEASHEERQAIAKALQASESDLFPAASGRAIPA